MAANYYVIQTGTPAPNLFGTPYQGYTIRTVTQMNQAYTWAGGQRVAAGDHVVVDGSVRENLWLNPAGGTTTGFRLNVTILDNANSFKVDVGTASQLNFTRPNLQVDVTGTAPNVTIGGDGRMNSLTVTLDDGTAIGNISGGNGNDQVTIGTGATARNINLNSGTDRIINNGTIGDVDMGGGLSGVATYTAGPGARAGRIGASGRELSVDLADGATTGNIAFVTGVVDARLTLTTGENATLGNIRAAQTALNSASQITIGDGSTVGDIGTGDNNSTGGHDRIILGARVTSGSIRTYNGQDVIEIGDGSRVEGDIVTRLGRDTITIGADVRILGRIESGDGIDLRPGFDRDRIIIGDRTHIGDHIYTGWDSDYVELGDAVTFGGRAVGADAQVFTSGGSDTIVATGNGNYRVNTGIGDPDEDILIVQYRGSAAPLRNALISQGFSQRATSPHGEGVWSRGENQRFVYNGITYENVDWVRIEPVCFAAGTLIDTAHGPVAVEDLTPGDLVHTRDHGLQPVRWVGVSPMAARQLRDAPQFRPIRIRAGALGPGMPAQDLVVSPQHRVLVRSKIAQRMCASPEILVAAKQLLAVDGIDIATDVAHIVYVHILFDQHQIIRSNGADTESLFTGPQALRSIGAAARDELFALFPDLRLPGFRPAPARLLVPGRLARRLAQRHADRGKMLIT
ncbi:Hint domain-containing protein [Paracoccus sp. (in: a-proteobacteria)]|uniref:Hint domain-containing protein n=1 Tax=Paracoccus sp. TaxID=267 RepID=UPI0026DF5CB4|nr:Hint domain-containing protein [Paracoccus sp. (in: a-proteobacteria)]MDO5647464.1 Hint domain-containing protein [Paracoccus sp. (in: a-proteobacteria)]